MVLRNYNVQSSLEEVRRRLCLCVHACELAAVSAVLILHSRTHVALQPPQRTDRGNSSDVDKWDHTGMDSAAGNTAVQPAVAAHKL